MSNKKTAPRKVFPVLDLLHRRVVHAVAGERGDYQPVSGELAGSSDPATVAAAFRDRFGFCEAYVADLGAIAGAEPDWDAISAIGRAGFRLWLDAGLRTVDQAASLSKRSIAWGERESVLSAVVAGLETVPGLGALQEMLDAVGPERLVFSLDLKAGQPLRVNEQGTNDQWVNEQRQVARPEDILASVLKLGVRRFLILDLAQVGTQRGTLTEPLCRTLRGMSVEIEIAAGGGVRDVKDIQALQQAGCNVVLIASALHAGKIRPEDLDSLKCFDKH